MADLTHRFRVSRELDHVALNLDGTAICKIKAPDQEVLRKQLVHLRNYADLRMDRIGEINIQATDIISFFGAQHHLNGSRRVRTLELLFMTQSIAIHLEMIFKHFCLRPRPIDLAPQVQPIIQTPDHSTFPSGHATEAYAVATILNRIANSQSALKGLEDKALPFRLAHRIAINRTIAGVHFPVDSASGAMLGCAIGEALYALASGENVPIVFDYNVNAGFSLDFSNGVYAATGRVTDNGDFTQEILSQFAGAKIADADAGAAVPKTAEIFQTFWEFARKEFEPVPSEGS